MSQEQAVFGILKPVFLGAVGDTLVFALAFGAARCYMFELL